MVDPITILVTPIVKKVIDAAIDFGVHEISLICGLKGEIKNLSEVLEIIKDVLQDAEKRQINNAGLKGWLTRLRDAAYDAEDILDLFATKAHLWERERKVSTLKKLSPGGIIIKKWFDSKAAHAIEELLERFSKINRARDEFGLQILQINVEGMRVKDRPEKGSRINSSEVVGREVDKETIINELLTGPSNTTTSDNFIVIPIIGIGGAGKTTLAQLVFNDDRISKHFDIYKMWVCVNVNFDLNRILKEMIRAHSKVENDNLDHLSRHLLESRVEAFLPNNRFLLVLDDVWTENLDHWDSLKGLLNKGAPGSRVLLTSRSTKVANMFNSGLKPHHHLGLLTEDESKRLFRKCAFTGDFITNELDMIGNQIALKCSGLPLAIKAMAGLLLGNLDVNYWRQILENDIWRIEEKDHEIDNLKVMAALRLSFDHLPSYLKQCFLFCSIFPKAHSYDKSELVKIWNAEGFIPLDGRNKQEDTGSEYFEKLLVRSFFLLSDVGRAKTYRMHDLIHDLARSISGPITFEVVDGTSCEGKDTSRHVSVLCENAEKPISELITRSKKVRTVLLRGRNLRDYGKILDNLFHSLKYVRVLDLSLSSIDALPNSIEELELLRYLDLSKTEIQMLPNSICNLWNLQTLRLLGCLWLHELPKGLAKLTSLRHLELDDIFWYKLSRLPVDAGSLSNLHNLHKFWVGPEKGYGIEELKEMTSLTGALHLLKLENVVNAKDAKLNEKKALHKVVFQWSNKDDDAQIDEKCHENTLNDLQPYSEVEELQIIHFSGSRFPSWITNGSLKMLTSVSLEHCVNCKTLSVGALPKLTSLDLKGMHELEEWADLQQPSLKVLEISGCPKLKALPGFFAFLRVLKIKKCNSLKILPVAPSLSFLILMDNASLDVWNEVIVQFSENDQNRLQPSLLNLLEVKIIRCPMLKGLPKFFSPQKLEISDCDQLISLPPVENPGRLGHLALDTSSDGTLISLIPASNAIYSLVISNISNISSLPNFPSLPGLKALYLRNCTDLEHLCQAQDNLQTLTSLKFLSIQNCPNLKDLPTCLPPTLECLTIASCPNLQNLGPNQMLKTLASLKDLSIQNCVTLQSLPDDGFPDSLKHLKIHGCPRISQRCFAETGDGPDWPKIRDIPDLEINFVRKSSTTQSVTIVPEEASSSTSWFKKLRCCRKY